MKFSRVQYTAPSWDLQQLSKRGPHQNAYLLRHRAAVKLLIMMQVSRQHRRLNVAQRKRLACLRTRSAEAAAWLWLVARVLRAVAAACHAATCCSATCSRSASCSHTKILSIWHLLSFCHIRSKCTQTEGSQILQGDL